MAYGALVIPRTRYASKVVSIDDSEAKKIPGFIKAVKIDDSMGKCTGWVVAVADRFPTAMKAAKALKVKWDAGPYANLGSAEMLAQYKELSKNERKARPGCSKAMSIRAFGSAEKVFEVEYTTDMVCHATMEPLNATVQITNGEWHVHVGTQSTSFARMTLTAIFPRCSTRSPRTSRSSSTSTSWVAASAASRTTTTSWRPLTA